MLTSYAFQAAPFVFFVAGGAWRRINGTLWREEDGGRTCYTFFWPKMRPDVERFIACCTTCQKAKYL